MSTTPIYYFVINMDKNEDRWEVIQKDMDSIGCEYERVRAVDGTDMENDEDCRDILAPREDLLGSTLECVGQKCKWVYDGLIRNSFPGLGLNSHSGYKGLEMSNHKTYRLIREMLRDETCKYDWFCILEDDAQMNETVHKRLCNFVKNRGNQQFDVIRLDSRANGWGGTAGILYHRRIIDRLIEDLHPLSEFSITNEQNKNGENLWDWKLWSYLNVHLVKHSELPIVKSGAWVSMISPPR